jgi:hypothetical protein
MVAFTDLQHHISGQGEKSSGKTQGGGRKPPRQDSSSRGEACLNWNRGACEKPPTECIRFHVCSKCRGPHKRMECALAKGAK